MGEQRSDLKAEADIDFQQRTWRVQRAGWAVFVILLLGALALGRLSAEYAKR